MNRDTLKGSWKQFKGKIREKWGELRDDEIEETRGNVQQLSGLIQRKYGETKDRIREELDQFCEDCGYSFEEDESIVHRRSA